MKTIVVVGATGDVGRGIVSELLAAGFRVVGVGRSPERLARLAEHHAGSGAFSALQGTVESRATAADLAHRIAATGAPDTVVTTVNGAQHRGGIFELEAAALEATLRDNLSTHLLAAQSLIPIVAAGGMYLGIGGGMADLVFPGSAAISIGQAAQRAMFRYLAKEGEARPVLIRELLLYAMIAGESNRDVAEPHWITAGEVGRHVTAIVTDPQPFEGPILALKSRKQIGLPERKPA